MELETVQEAGIVRKLAQGYLEIVDGQKLKVVLDGEELFKETVPNKKAWKVSISIQVTETDA